MHITIEASPTRAILLRSHHFRSSLRSKRQDLDKPRSEASFGSKSYKDGLQRAFNNAKKQIFFNPDMDQFITLTYADNMQDLDKALHDIKIFIKKERRRLSITRRLPTAGVVGQPEPKYIFIFEYQKRGAIHVHMIANKFFKTYTNQNGYNSLSNWKHGFSSVLTIRDFDSNFKPYLYLFKYMRKSQRIGKSFVHSSRNLNNFDSTTASIDYSKWSELIRERTCTVVNGRNLTFYRHYLAKLK